MGLTQPKVAFAWPWVALGPKSLFSDSGFILLYEALIAMHERHGMMSLILLDPLYKEKFDQYNKPKETGVYGVYSETNRVAPERVSSPIGSDISNKYLNSAICPVDFLITNKKVVVPLASAMSVEVARDATPLPVYFFPLFAGVEGTGGYTARFEVRLRLEAAAYLSASRTIWTTTEQKDRGMEICRRFLSATSVRRIRDDSSIIGGGILTQIEKHILPDAEVCKRLQNKPKNFRVSYIGRMTSNKSVDKILDAVFALFAMYSIKIEVVTTGSFEIPRACKRVNGIEEAKNLIVDSDNAGTKGREYYIENVLKKQQCVLYASKTEGHPSVPREVIYLGVPCLLPDRPWARAMFRDKYPFYYDSESSLIAKTKLIMAGKVSNEDVTAFNACRHDKDCIELMYDTAEKFYQMAAEDVTAVQDVVLRRQHDKVMKAFLDEVPAGTTFTWSDLPKAIAKSDITIAQRSRVFNLTQLYKLVHEYVKVLDPEKGTFERVT